jgi:uncharacterized protein (DUF885 family)
MTDSESPSLTQIGAADFDALVDTWIAEELAVSPVEATILGADGDHGSLGAWSASALEQRHASDEGWLRRLTALYTAQLDLDRSVDAGLLQSALRGRRVYADWEHWRRDPATYLDPCLHGVFSLFLNRLFPEPELVSYAASRLGEVPQVLADARANLRSELVNPLICERGLGQARAAVPYFRELLPAEVTDQGLRTTLSEAGDVAASAMEEFASYLEGLTSDSKGSYALGEERYTTLLRDKELLGYGAEELRRRGEAAWAEIDEQMQELAREVDPSADSWRSVIESLNADHPSSPEEMLSAYADWTARARAYLSDNDLVTLPEGEKCLVEPSPPFQRPILAVASYSQPPAFRPGLTGHFFVPFPPEGTSSEDVQKRLASNSFHSIPTISVHEAYPGHHWHLTWMKANPRRVRQMVWSSYYAEGWALYAEKMMREQGFYEDPRAELCHLDARIFRAARIIVDTGLHIGDLDVESAVEIMRTRASLPEPVARAEVGRYCAWPTQAPSYLTGSLEIERIRETYLSEKRGDLKQFHDSLCGTGSMPLGLAEEALMGS